MFTSAGASASMAITNDAPIHKKRAINTTREIIFVEDEIRTVKIRSMISL